MLSLNFSVYLCCQKLNIYKMAEEEKEFNDWTNRKKEIGDNSKPGEGTRRRIEKETEIKLFNLQLLKLR